MADENRTPDTRVTPSFDSANVRALPHYDDDTAPLFGPVVDAFDTALAVVGRIHDAREAAAQDTTLNENARIVKVADFADTLLETATRAFDRANTVVGNNIAALEKALTEPVESSAANSAVSREIRDHVRGLKGVGAAMGFVTDCIKRRDFGSASAVLGAPHFLSGLTPEAQAVLLRMFHEARDPQTSKRLAALKAAQEHLDRNSPLLFKQVEKAVGGDYRKVQMIRKGANASKKAFGGV
jgi:hypothetical protein